MGACKWAENFPLRLASGLPIVDDEGRGGGGGDGHGRMGRRISREGEGSEVKSRIRGWRRGRADTVITCVGDRHLSLGLLAGQSYLRDGEAIRRGTSKYLAVPLQAACCQPLLGGQRMSLVPNSLASLCSPYVCASANPPLPLSAYRSCLSSLSLSYLSISPILSVLLALTHTHTRTHTRTHTHIHTTHRICLRTMPPSSSHITYPRPSPPFPDPRWGKALRLAKSDPSEIVGVSSKRPGAGCPFKSQERAGPEAPASWFRERGPAGTTAAASAMGGLPSFLCYPGCKTRPMPFRIGSNQRAVPTWTYVCTSVPYGCPRSLSLRRTVDRNAPIQVIYIYYHHTCTYYLPSPIYMYIYTRTHTHIHTYTHTYIYIYISN
ncbi:hypothetical protein GGS23DRAFT_519012 [Durotheca rogersii]|uniref:uncharacterized protein n=1 Tax=Durotheca rogersii TaxID=419775 RepID=UPI00221FB432|nr:uncharacterized protein GGS23DRAFT_519012 [Durotheca rogersii]KAI5863897.1 hypothetical protein GGS23DRAFT_519012 [Durotheca rogersii]